MKQSRRDFIRNAGLLSTLALGGQYVSSCTSKSDIEAFGIQLWTLKEDMALDHKATLNAVANAGYKFVESFNGDKGIFWGEKAVDFKKILDDLGLQMFSSHIDPSFTQKVLSPYDFKKLVDQAATIGVKYLINPFPGEFNTGEQWKKTAEGLNKQGLMCKSGGLSMGYHNHHFEFLPTLDGMIPEQYLLDNTDKDLVKFELDLYWVVKAGQDPIKWITENKGRFELFHVKDLHKSERIKEIQATEKDGPFWPAGLSTYIGNGQIDFPKILKVAQKNGGKHFIVEQERFDGSTPLKDIVKDANYLKAFKFA